MSAHYSRDFFCDHYLVTYIVSTITVGNVLMWKGIMCLNLLLYVLLAGDSTVNGATISIVPGHIIDPEFAKKIFVSPSIRYCTYGDIYTKSEM